MPIDPFAVLNALLRAEAARSSEHETKAPTTTTSTAPAPAPTAAPAPARTSEPRRDGHDKP
ncbi:hypothetical protein P3L51_06060 [Streptomyces sp. PSRA5]|uniref:hypothetical protein n=1 Tax=Streptomyces panacea TaxID=3035064 RepID=UPI00339D14CF